MADSSPPTLIAVDGGGTSCRIAVLRNGKRSEIRTGRANVSSDRDGAVQTIRRGLAEAAEAAGLVQADLPACRAYLGLAGVVGAEEARFVALHLPFDHVTVEDDRPAAVVGALDGAVGTVAGIGTGSFIARQAPDGLRLMGGWGFVLGDEASGAWLGRRLLARVLHTVDGLAAASPLSESLLDELGGTGGVVRYSLSAAPRDFASLAPRILEAASAGDALALALLGEGAAYVERGARALGWQEGETLCLIGGLAPHYAPYLPAPLAEALAPPAGNALDGALRLAARVGPEARP